MKHKKFKNRIFTVTALAASLCMVFSSCSANVQRAGVKTVDSVSVRNVISTPAEGNGSLHFVGSNEDYSQIIASSGLVDLCLDSNTTGIAVHDKSGNLYWTALPVSDDESLKNSDCDAAMVSLKIIGGTDIYYLNSQDNSVAYEKACVDIEDNGATFTYDIYSDASVAAKESFAPNDIGFRVILNITLEDGNLNVNSKWSNLTGNKNAYIEELSVLNYFGAYNEMDESDFLLVPDGCGAVIRTSVFDESFENLSFPVYGDDISVTDESSGKAIIPAFGIKRRDSAVAALIEKGDAVACIKAEKAKDLNSFNRAYASFCITPSTYENQTLCISEKSTVDNVSLCYRFLSGINATYSGIASSLREQLIRNSVLSTKTISSTDYLPFFVTLNGTVKKNIGKFTYLDTLTDFEEAGDMLVRIKNKGINNVNVRYKAVLKGGCDPVDITDSGFLRKMGGTEKLNDLCEYVSGQKMGLYIDMDMLSSPVEFSGGNALSINKDKAYYTPVSGIADKAGVSLASRYLRQISGLKKVIAGILADTRNYSFTGFCLGDAGNILYSDFSQNGLLRQEAAETIAGTISPLSTGHSIMIDGGNFYMLKNVDSVIELPMTTSVAKSGAYIPVPLVQIVLHGIADYAGEPVNTQINTKEAMLRCVEFGACPHYLWNYSPIAGNGDGDIYYYDNTVNSAAEFYTKANRALNDLRSARMTDHSEIAPGVFCTEYDTGAMIYVNYTGRDYSVLGITVGAGDFLRLN